MRQGQEDQQGGKPHRHEAPRSQRVAGHSWITAGGIHHGWNLATLLLPYKGTLESPGSQRVTPVQ